jgi:hypothetical protein
MSSNYIEYLNRTSEISLTLGDEFSYRCGNRNLTLRVIRTTSKGINFLIVELDRVLFTRRHMYDRKWSGKKVPYGTRTFNVRVSDFIVNKLVPLTPAKEA